VQFKLPPDVDNVWSIQNNYFVDAVSLIYKADFSTNSLNLIDLEKENENIMVDSSFPILAIFQEKILENNQTQTNVKIRSVFFDEDFICLKDIYTISSSKNYMLIEKFDDVVIVIKVDSKPKIVGQFSLGEYYDCPTVCGNFVVFGNQVIPLDYI